MVIIKICLLLVAFARPAPYISGWLHGSQPRLTVVGQDDEGMTSTAFVIPAGEAVPGSSAGILFECKARDD